MLTKYSEAAMRHARCEVFAEDGSHYCEIPECPGVWSNADTLDEALIELRSALEDWIAFGLAMHDPLPEIDGIAIAIKGVA
jgi:predicted RNase H-like HicB family nuclease